MAKRGVIMFTPPGWIWAGMAEELDGEIVLTEATYVATIAQQHCAWDLAHDPTALGSGWPVAGPVRIVRGPGLIVVEADEAAIHAIHIARDRATLRGGK